MIDINNLFSGVIHLMQQDLTNLEAEERYIHAIATTLTGGKILFTANPFLLGRIHKAISIYVDTTFKRTAGEMNEWEIVMWDEEVQRGM
jgi:hypothetical protein